MYRNRPDLQDCYDKGLKDGKAGTDEHDAAMSYGSREEVGAYHQGVKDGERKASK